jgi:hypothetical protein
MSQHYQRDPHLGTCVDKRPHARHTLRTSWGEFGCPGWPKPGAVAADRAATDAAAELHDLSQRAALAACRRYGIPEQHAAAVARLMRDIETTTTEGESR